MGSYMSPYTNRHKSWYAVMGNRRVYLCRANGNTRKLKRLMRAFEISNACNSEYLRFKKM